MALTNAASFGNAVLADLKTPVPPVELATWPLLEPALRFAAAWAYEEYLRGELGERTLLPDGAYVRRAMSLADHHILAHLDMLGAVGWPSRAGLRQAVEASLLAVFQANRANP